VRPPKKRAGGNLMIFILLIAAWVLVLGVAVGMCKAAAVGDRQLVQQGIDDAMRPQRMSQPAPSGLGVPARSAAHAA
jgi:hypothetical protein